MHDELLVCKITHCRVESLSTVAQPWCVSSLGDPCELKHEEVGKIDLKDTMQFYAFRAGRHPTAAPGEAQFQCIVKLPKKNRPELLQGSGSSQLLIRDFVENGQQSTDLTVIPRFWDVSPQNLHEALIVTQKVAGFAGVIITRRGLAVRSWTNNVAYMRKAVIPSDSRITTENISVVPRFSYKSTGWPPAVDPAEHCASSHESRRTTTYSDKSVQVKWSARLAHRIRASPHRA